MAIQFNCPYCTAMIRVPDSAAGKRGACPKCATKLLVPQVGPAVGTPPENPPATEPGEIPTPEDGPPDFSNLTDAAPKPAGPTIAQTVRRRGRKKGLNPLIPIGIFVVLIASLGYWMLKPKVNIEGKLTAKTVDDFTIPPALIEKSLFQVSAAEADGILEEMKANLPEGVRIPDWYEMRFDPQLQRGIQVIIEPTIATEVVRVNLSAAKGLRKALESKLEAGLKQQRSEFRSAMEKFLKEWKEARRKDASFVTMEFRETLGFNRLTTGLGYILAAQVDGRPYRCVHQDAEGNLYFLLPRSIEKFALVGRKMSDGTVYFDGRIPVVISKPKTTPPAKPEAAPAPVEPTEEPAPMEKSADK